MNEEEPQSRAFLIRLYTFEAEPKPGLSVGWGDFGECHGDGLIKGFDGPCLCLTEDLLEFGPGLFDGIKIGRIGRWAAFLSNHREAIAAMDFFTVPTLTFSVLYCFFVIAHDRRRILHFNVTRHPSSVWVTQQLREAFPYDSAPSHLIFDRGANFNDEVTNTVKSFGIQPKRTSFRSPWQNGVAERWVGSCRRDLMDHVIVVNERHLKRLMNEYIRYYHEDRTHLALGKGNAWEP